MDGCVISFSNFSSNLLLPFSPILLFIVQQSLKSFKNISRKLIVGEDYKLSK